MTSPTLRLVLTLLVATLLATAAAQGGAGIALGWTARIDAPVLDVPPDATDVTRVVARAEGGAEPGADVAPLTLDHGAVGGPRLSGTLPDLRGNPLLQPITSEELWPCALQASADARFAPVALWAVGAPAVLELVNAPLPAEPAPGYRQLLLLFADAEVRVQGTCPEAPTSLRVDLHLRPGWNLAVSESLPADGVDAILLRSSDAADLDGVAWRWRDTRAQGPTEVAPKRE